MTIPGITEIASQDLFGWGNIPKFTGDLWFVDAGAGVSGNGQLPDTAFLTIAEGIAAALPGDAVSIKAGTYDEAGLNMNVASLELWGQIGTIIQDTAGGTVLTVSANTCRVRGDIKIAPTGAVGVSCTGDFCYFDRVRIIAATTAWDIQGDGCVLEMCRAGQPTLTAFSLSGSKIRLDDCSTSGVNGSTRGYWVNSNADFARIRFCASTGHGAAGFQIDSGSAHCMIFYCASGAGDGDHIDGGDTNMWVWFQDRMRRERHEHLYPASDGEGTAGAPVVVVNSTTDDLGGARDDQDYWGDPIRVIAPSVLTNSWLSVGVYIDAVTANKDLQWQAFYPQTEFSSAQNGGNDWDKDEVALTVADGSTFLANDLVWITGTDRPDGEILKVVSVVSNVVTIVSETRMGGGVGVRYDYDIAPSVNRMYVVYRTTNRTLHGFDGGFSAGSAKDFSRFVWESSKYINPNGGMIMRVLNGTDALAASFGIRAIYVN